MPQLRYSSTATPTPTPANVINVLSYGAKGNDNGNDSASIQQALKDARRLNRPVYLPKGTYNVGTAQLKLLNDESCDSGVTMYGDGVGLTVINAQQVTASPQILFYSERAITQNCHNVYVNVKGIGFLTNTPGIGLQVGSDDYQDPFNELEMDIMVFNANTSASAEAIRLNHVLNADLFLSATTAGPGTALKVRQVDFSHIAGTLTAPGGTAVHIADGFTYGNVFMGLNMQDVNTCVVSDTDKSHGNTFVGGNCSYRESGVRTSRGRRLMFMNTLNNPIAPATTAHFVGKDSLGNPLDVGLSMLP
jgi:hypothetical protein